MFVGKARAYRSDAPFHALLTNIEKLVRDKHSSLSRKMFNNNVLWTSEDIWSNDTTSNDICSTKYRLIYTSDFRGRFRIKLIHFCNNKNFLLHIQTHYSKAKLDSLVDKPGSFTRKSDFALSCRFTKQTNNLYSLK
jgi:hypothetical protein